jgi:hypothetical protein
MSSAVISTSAALSRPFVFDAKAVPEVSLPFEPENESSAQLAPASAQPRPPQRIRRPNLSAELASADPRLAHITPASRLDIRPAPEMVSSGIPAIDALTGGMPRGCLTEICGPASSGRTTLLLAALAAATRRGEFCAVVDASDVLDPHSAQAAGVDLDRLLWVRCGDEPKPKSHAQQKGCPISRASGEREACPEFVEWVGISSQPAFDFKRTSSHQSDHRLEQVLRATDLLLESGGFGLIVLDLGDLPPQAARRIPLTTWFRFRRAIEHTPTILLTIEQQPIAGSCSSMLLKLGAAKRRKNVAPGLSRGLGVEAPEERKKDCTCGSKFAQTAHAHLLSGLEITAELIVSRLERKPARSVVFATKTAWAG